VRFGLTSFAELLPESAPIIGEDPGSFKGFYNGMMQSLLPFTPYECVVAENLIAIEWEILEHRGMRDASLRKIIHRAVCDAVVARESEKHDAALDDAWEQFIKEGGAERDWENPLEFDEAAVKTMGDELASRAVSNDRNIQEIAYAEIIALGLSPVEVMSEAYSNRINPATRHDDKIQELERRRREVKRAFDALQKVRPLEAEVVEG
jgi:hypothetical protein